MGLNPFKIKAECCIYLWTKNKERNNEQHGFFLHLSPYAAEVVSSGEDGLFEMHVF